MSIHSADTPSLASEAYAEYRRFERYLAPAYALVLVAAVSLMCPGSVTLGCLALGAVIGFTFRRYHRAVHHYVGNPSARTDRAVQMWGTASQASIWAAVPIAIAMVALQLLT